VGGLYSLYGAAQGFQNGQYFAGSLAIVGAGLAFLGAYGAFRDPQGTGLRLAGGRGAAQGGNGTGGNQLADSGGTLSDAQNPAAGVTAEPGLQPGDRSAAMILGERVRGAQVRAILAKYGGNIEAAAADFSVDPGLIRGIIYEEQTHLLPGEGLAEQFGGGRTVGLGQMTEGLHGFTRAQLLDPATNIRAVATHLSYLQGQPLIAPNAPLASLATSYNCASCTAISAYGRRVVFYRSGL
jgi:hypothetical protein